MHDRGLVTLKAAFENAKQQRHAAFIPYFPIGYPDYETSLQVIASLAESGADIIEVGVPFSDPLADGPTIQAATQKALENGTTLRQCIQAIQSLREQGIQTPMVLMGYLNPFMAYGFEHLVDDACVAGIDGFVVPDMPADEAALFQPLVETAEMGLAHFLAPTSSPQRIRLAAEKSRGYIYLVSVTGVTGTSTGLPDDLVKRIADIRLVTQQPIAVGFGIRTPEHATAVGKIADGVIVGSALIQAAGTGLDALTALAVSLHAALRKDG